MGFLRKVLKNLHIGSEKDKPYLCDICNNEIYKPEGYYLITEQVIACPNYWEHYFKIQEHLIKLLPPEFESIKCKPDDVLFKVLLSSIEQVAASPTPWITCEDCIGKFSINEQRAREYAIKWWNSGKRFQAPGNGPAPLHKVQLPENKPWGRAINLLINKR